MKYKDIKIDKHGCTDDFMKSLNEFLAEKSKHYDPEYPVIERDTDFLNMIVRSSMENGKSNYELSSFDSKSGNPEHFYFDIGIEQAWDEEYEYWEYLNVIYGKTGEFQDLEEAEKSRVYQDFYFIRKGEK